MLHFTPSQCAIQLHLLERVRRALLSMLVVVVVAVRSDVLLQVRHCLSECLIVSVLSVRVSCVRLLERVSRLARPLELG